MLDDSDIKWAELIDLWFDPQKEMEHVGRICYFKRCSFLGGLLAQMT